MDLQVSNISQSKADIDFSDNIKKKKTLRNKLKVKIDFKYDEKRYEDKAFIPDYGSKSAK